MAKVKDSVWSVFGSGVAMYFQNFGSFFKYMAFPVLGQVLGILLTLGAAFLYAVNLPKWIVSGGIFDNFSLIFLILLLICLPGLLVFAIAFWNYLVAYSAVNSMVESMLKSGKVYDFPAHTETVTRRSASFVGVWLLLSLFILIGSFPLLWIIAGIIFVYFVLIFQVFSYEPDKSPVGCVSKSIKLIKGNFARTLGLMILLGILTYWALPKLFEMLFTIGNIITFFAMPFDVWAQLLPLNHVNEKLMLLPFHYQITSLFIAKLIVDAFLGYVVIGFTLPLRTICWALWYKNLNKAEAKPLDKRILDRATAKGKEE